MAATKKLRDGAIRSILLVPITSPYEACVHSLTSEALLGNCFLCQTEKDRSRRVWNEILRHLRVQRIIIPYGSRSAQAFIRATKMSQDARKLIHEAPCLRLPSNDWLQANVAELIRSAAGTDDQVITADHLVLNLEPRTFGILRDGVYGNLLKRLADMPDESVTMVVAPQTQIIAILHGVHRTTPDLVDGDSHDMSDVMGVKVIRRDGRWRGILKKGDHCISDRFLQ